MLKFHNAILLCIFGGVILFVYVFYSTEIQDNFWNNLTVCCISSSTDRAFAFHDRDQGLKPMRVRILKKKPNFLTFRSGFVAFRVIFVMFIVVVILLLFYFILSFLCVFFRSRPIYVF